MRTQMFLAAIAASSASALGACSWTQFDDLGNEAWVGSTEKPDVKSSDYGIAVQRASRSGDGGRLVVLGAGTATYSELIYSASGASSLPPTTLGLQQAFGIPNIGNQPLLLADPSSDNVSLVVTSDNGVAILTGAQGQLKPYQLFNQTAPDAATYMLAPGQSAPQPLVAVADTVFGAFLPALPTGMPQPACKLVDPAAPTTKLAIHALGAVRVGGTDDVLVWDGGGKLFRFPSAVFNGCGVSPVPLASANTSFMPDQGSQILAIDANTVLLQGHHGDAGLLQVYNATTLAAIGPAVMVSKLRAAAVINVSGTSYAIAGAPAALAGGVEAGQVTLYKISGTGLDGTPAATLNDAQPEANQNFGRAVVAMPFNGKQVIVVAANNEIFVYFRANLAAGTTLYDETRQGR